MLFKDASGRVYFWQRRRPDGSKASLPEGLQTVSWRLMLTGLVGSLCSLACAGAGTRQHSGGGHGDQERHRPLQSAGQTESQPHPHHRPR